MKNTRRIIALCLAIVMMMSMAITASAASVSWTTSDGNSYVATVNEGRATTRTFIVSGTTKHHDGQTETYLTATTSNAIAAYASTDFPSNYNHYLVVALGRTPTLSSTRTLYPSSNNLPTFRLTETSQIGDYSIYAVVAGKEAPWTVDRNNFEIAASGTAPYAPTAVISDYTIRRISS